MEQVSKAWIAAQGIKEGMYFEELQNVRLLLIGPLPLGKCLLLVAKSQIGIHKVGPARMLRAGNLINTSTHVVHETPSFRYPCA